MHWVSCSTRRARGRSIRKLRARIVSEAARTASKRSASSWMNRLRPPGRCCAAGRSDRSAIALADRAASRRTCSKLKQRSRALKSLSGCAGRENRAADVLDWTEEPGPALVVRFSLTQERLNCRAAREEYLTGRPSRRRWKASAGTFKRCRGRRPNSDKRR